MVVKGWDDEQSAFRSESASEALWATCFLHTRQFSFFPIIRVPRHSKWKSGPHSFMIYGKASTLKSLKPK